MLQKMVFSQYKKIFFISFTTSFLQMLSTKASQNITYHCQNSVGYHHARRDHKRKAIMLQSWNDLEINHRGKFRYDVLSDDCQHESTPETRFSKLLFSKTLNL